jgi:hypothetical protein
MASAVENIFYYVPAHKILGAKFFTMASLNLANGSLTADITPAQFPLNGGGEGMADTWIQPANLAWNFKRADVWVGYAFVAPTGKFSPGASNNVGSGRANNCVWLFVDASRSQAAGSQAMIGRVRRRKAQSSVVPRKAF